MKKFYPRYITTIAVVLLSAGMASAQQLFRLTQYFQNPIAINPATTGIEGFLDVKIGYRQQWSGLEGAPETYYLSAHGPLRKSSSSSNFQNNSLRISNPTLYDQSGSRQVLTTGNTIKHGVGGYVSSDVQGIFTQTSGFATYATHFPLGEQLRLSVGVAAGVVNQQIDVSDITVVEANDPTYQAYRNQQGKTTNFDVNAGLFLYNDLFYVGYSAARIFQNRLYTDSEIAAEQRITHFGLLGLRLNVSETLLLVPGAFIGYDGLNPITYDLGARLKLKDILWFGASYRNTQTIAGMAGVSINNMFNISYSYDYGFSGINNFQSGIHELTLGFELFNQGQVAPYLW